MIPLINRDTVVLGADLKSCYQMGKLSLPPSPSAIFYFILISFSQRRTLPRLSPSIFCHAADSSITSLSFFLSLTFCESSLLFLCLAARLCLTSALLFSVSLRFLFLQRTASEKEKWANSSAGRLFHLLSLSLSCHQCLQL